MSTEAFQTPVALFVFKRPDTTRRVFEVIAKVKPAKLLLIADGPRLDRQGEAEACVQVRDIVSQIDWPCDVVKNFAETNLGCQERMISGMDWVFSLVEEAIIFEDDCLPDPSFFPFCQELLDRYRGDKRIISITGSNLVEKNMATDASYYFSQLGGNWGWATWSSAWQLFDRCIKDWPKLKAEGLLSEIFDQPKTVAYWSSAFDMMYANSGPSAWDYQWLFARLKNNALTIVPRVNLVSNIGFGPGATHTGAMDSRFRLPVRSMKFPLNHPSSFVPLRSADRSLQRLFITPRIQSLIAKVRRVARELHSNKVLGSN